MKVLVVGGAGYIGSMVTRALWEQGDDVTVFDSLLFGSQSLDPLLGEPRFRMIAGDLCDEQRLRTVVPGHEAVCLFAAIVGEPACNRDPALTVETNWHGARRVVEAAKAAGAERFLFASTCSNYGVSTGSELVDEEAPLCPRSTYSRTKIAAERDILAAADPSFHPTVLRIGTTFGISARMRFDLLLSDFTLAAVQDHKIVIYGEHFWRPFVHVRDVAKSVRQVLGADLHLVSGEVFNVGANDANTQKLDLGLRVQQHIPGTELEIVDRDSDARSCGDARSYRVDFSKLNCRLGYSTEWSIDDGIRELHAALVERTWDDPSDRRYYN